jgi:hypothetical protein
MCITKSGCCVTLLTLLSKCDIIASVAKSQNKTKQNKGNFQNPDTYILASKSCPQLLLDAGHNAPTCTLSPTFGSQCAAVM